MMRISIIKDAEERSDNDIILNCIKGDSLTCSDDEDLPVLAFVLKLRIT